MNSTFILEDEPWSKGLRQRSMPYRKIQWVELWNQQILDAPSSSLIKEHLFLPADRCPLRQALRSAPRIALFIQLSKVLFGLHSPLWRSEFSSYLQDTRIGPECLGCGVVCFFLGFTLLRIPLSPQGWEGGDKPCQLVSKCFESCPPHPSPYRMFVVRHDARQIRASVQARWLRHVPFLLLSYYWQLISCSCDCCIPCDWVNHSKNSLSAALNCPSYFAKLKPQSLPLRPRELKDWTAARREDLGGKKIP